MRKIILCTDVIVEMVHKRTFKEYLMNCYNKCRILIHPATMSEVEEKLHDECDIQYFEEAKTEGISASIVIKTRQKYKIKKDLKKARHYFQKLDKSLSDAEVQSIILYFQYNCDIKYNNVKIKNAISKCEVNKS